jgi:flagellar biosynthesis chaperone FliJ
MRFRDRLRDAIKGLRGTAAAEYRALAQQVSTLKDDGLAAMAEAVSSRADAERHRIEGSALRERVGGLEGALRAEQEAEARLRSALATQTAALEDSRSRERALVSNEAGLRLALDAATERQQALSEQIVALQSAVKEGAERERALSTTIEELRNQIAGKHNYLASLEAQVDAQDAAISELRAELDGARAAVLEANAVEGPEIAQYRERSAAAEQELERAHAELSSAASRADEAERRLDLMEGEFNALKERWAAARIPPILFTTMPRSGTYFISTLFAEGLRIKPTIVSNQYFPHDTVRYHALKELANGNYVSQDHFAASRINLTHISRFMDRMVCHVRDPRQALLSWVHHIEQYRGNPETHLFIYPPLPADFYERALDGKLRWAVDNWLPLLVSWTEEWVRAADAGGPVTIKFTHFERMIEDTQAFAFEVLDFFAIPRDRFVPPKIALDEKIHFRRGETEEWRRVFPAVLRRRAASLIPGALAERMGWRLRP